MPDKLERLLSELQAEVESRGEEDRTRLAEWFGGVLDGEGRRREQRVAFTDMLRRGHGLDEAGEGEDQQ